ncbi:hypothetical protein NGUA15_04982 [Salmonella enterica]|nr:hypothetical protein NGUA15_04982 [Salmonella enterica]
MMLPVRWRGGLDHQRADHHRNALGHRRLIFTYLIPECPGAVLFQEHKGAAGGKGWHCGGTLAVDMKRGHHRHVHVIIAQGDLPGRVVACKTQVVVGNYHPFRP